MGKKDFADYICRPLCMFFTEGEKEEMACLGAEAAAWLHEKGYIMPRQIGSIVKDRDSWEKHRTDLGAILCSKCAFRARDCDFQSPEPSVDLEPCGGYILLAHLLDARALKISDLEKAV